MNTPKNNRKTKAWSILATVLVLGSIAGLTAAGGLNAAANFVGHGSGDANADLNASDVDASLRSDVTDTLQANAAVQADLKDALETATQLQGKGTALVDSLPQISGEARSQIQGPAQGIVSKSAVTTDKLESQLDATEAAAVKLEAAMESNVREDVEEALEQMVATHAQGEEDLGATESMVTNITEDARFIEASCQFSTDLRGIAPTPIQAQAQAHTQANAEEIVELGTELKTQVDEALDSITSAQMSATATLNANLPSAGTVDGSVNGTGRDVVGQVVAGGPL